MPRSEVARYAVIGNPIGHSKSPQIHAAFAEQTGQSIAYERILGEPDRFDRRVREFFGAGGMGLNVTVPFKEAAWHLADIRTDRAELAGAVNTLLPVDNGIKGDNTDGAGLVRDLEGNHRLPLTGLSLLLLGAGGAARGVVGPLLQTRPASLHIANRTPERARSLAAMFASQGPVSGSGFDPLQGRRFDLIINATSAGLSDRVPAIPADILAPGGRCYDMMYADRTTAFQQWGYDHGAASAWDGLGMLVEQAAESFFVWRGIRPDTAPVITLLRSRTESV